MNSIDASLATLQPEPVFPELYAPLWWYSGSYAFSGSVAYYVQKGGTGSVSTTSSATKLITINANASPDTLYALELSGCVSLSSDNMSVELWDMTTNSAVSGTSLTFSTTTFVVARTGQFKLTPGHSYGIMYQSMSGSPSMCVTDISLIVFPNAQLTSPSVSAISLANPSGNMLKECYIPLWLYSSGASSNTNSTTFGSYFLQKGSNNCLAIANPIPSQIKLFSLDSGWSANQKFALEASFYPSNNIASASVALWDFNGGGTYGTVVSASELTSASATATLFRSGSFTLTPGHTYGVTLAISNTTYGTLLNKAHLVALAN